MIFLSHKSLNLVHYFLPPLKDSTLVFLQQVLLNQKNHMLIEDINPMSFPKFPEFTVQALWDNIEADDKIKSFLPDKTS
jgi:hypothetical protein